MTDGFPQRSRGLAALWRRRCGTRPTAICRAVEVDRLVFDPTRAQLGVAALDARSFVVHTPSAIPASFGGIAKPNAGGWHGRSRMETIPHNAVHNYVGGEAVDRSVGDMTELATAAVDPVFYAHHGNLDRLWEVWRQDPARKATEPTDPVFTQKQFLFPWIDGTIVSVPMRDVLDTRRLGYVYDLLAVLREGAVPANDAMPSDASGRKLASALARVPSGFARCILRISGVEPGDRPLSAEVCIGQPGGRPGDPASWISVGALAMGGAHGPAVFPDTEPRFDVTAAVRTLGTQTVEVAVLPLALGVGQRSWPPFRYAGLEDRHRGRMMPTAEIPASSCRDAAATSPHGRGISLRSLCFCLTPALAKNRAVPLGPAHRPVI